MDFTAKLAEYKKLIDDDINVYCVQLAKSTFQEYGPYSRDALGALTSVLCRGGKRLRGALAMHSYAMFGGDMHGVALQTARALELIHAYLLLNDDIADRSKLRRGGPTAHVQMQHYHRNHTLRGDDAHFGVSIALISALLGSHLAELVIDDLPVAPEVKLAASKTLHSHLVRTVHGQLLDIFNEALINPSEQRAVQVAELKTAYYTFVQPLQIGAILAGATNKDLALIHEYGLQAGVAFQVSDDIIGLFAPEEESGKSANDIKEGKITVLTAYALKHGTPAQNKQLSAILGNQNATSAQVKACKEIVVDTGALTHARTLVHDYSQRAMQVLAKAPAHWEGSHVQFLRALTQHLAGRAT